MTRRERVLATVRRQPADRVPMGEPYIQPGLCCRLLGKEYPRDYFCFERDYRVRMLLDMDLVVAGDWPEWKIGEDRDGRQIVKSVYGQTFLVGKETKRLLEPPIADIEDAYMPINMKNQISEKCQEN